MSSQTRVTELGLDRSWARTRVGPAPGRPCPPALTPPRLLPLTPDGSNQAILVDSPATPFCEVTPGPFSPRCKDSLLSWW